MIRILGLYAYTSQNLTEPPSLRWNESFRFIKNFIFYVFYYNNLKKKYGDNCNLLYTDTDSLILEIKTEDVYKDMANDVDNYDFSNYPEDHPLYSEDNNKL